MGIKKFDARVLAHEANADTSFPEWEYNLKLEGMGEFKISQVAARHWREGKVVRERLSQ